MVAKIKIILTQGEADLVLQAIGWGDMDGGWLGEALKASRRIRKKIEAQLNKKGGNSNE